MDFSVSGLRFEDQLRVVPGERIAIELGLPTASETWPGEARVVRVEEIPPDEQSFGESGQPLTHRIAVHLEQLPQAATAALIAFTLKIQQRSKT
jgi:hypothetical protein